MACALLLLAAAAFAQTPSRTNTTLRVLDRAAHDLREPTTDVRAALRTAADALPETAAGISIELRNFLKRLPEPGDDFRCGADFIRLRARLTLWRLLEKAMNESPPPLEPAICYAAPFALDATRLQAADGLVNLYGFDLDVVSPELILVTSGGYQDVTSALLVRTHYHLTAKLGGSGGIRIQPDVRSLGLVWGHLIRYSIPVVWPSTPLCASHVETIPTGKTVSYQPSASNELKARFEPLSADVVLEYSSNKLEARMCVNGADPASSGCTVEFLHTTDPDSVIEGVIGDWSFSPARPRRSLENGAATLRLSRIRVVASQSDGCISPIAYLEAKRSNIFDGATRDALDRQLKTVDRTILSLRPRFAPLNSP